MNSFFAVGAVVGVLTFALGGCATPLLDRQPALSQKSGNVLKSTSDLLDSTHQIAIRAEFIGTRDVLGWGVPTPEERDGQHLLMQVLCYDSNGESLELSYPRTFSRDRYQLAIVAGFQGALDAAAKAPSDQKLGTLAKSIFSGDMKRLADPKPPKAKCADELSGIMNGQYQSFPHLNAEGATVAPTGDIIPIIGDVIKIATAAASVTEKEFRDRRIAKFSKANAEHIVEALAVDKSVLTQSGEPKTVDSKIATILALARSDQIRFYLWSAVQDLNDLRDTTKGTSTDSAHRIAGDRLASDLSSFTAAYGSDTASEFNALALAYVTFFRCASDEENCTSNKDRLGAMLDAFDTLSAIDSGYSSYKKDVTSAYGS